ncbi:hypothetical protein D5F01_LYC10959 [Larimichthys crocea]|uniref:PiggyBac transposable element-derived protein domain-containing protein n=1 Tax=Larimichthys crocea TaxID=215358 RepID=A0A6G0IIV3_LARCR|nr:hypothetical protein D5F01_LYC10959 [Larimichthys crocea]
MRLRSRRSPTPDLEEAVPTASTDITEWQRPEAVGQWRVLKYDGDLYPGVITDMSETHVEVCSMAKVGVNIRTYSKEEKKKISVPCPKIVTEYNTHMEGVDLADMIIALYRTPAKSHRWYLAIFWLMVDIAVNNAWPGDAAPLGQKHQCLKDFRLDVAKGFIYPEKQKRGRPSKGNEDNTPPRVIKQPKVPRPVDDMRYDGIDHFPILSVKGRCRMCQDGQTSITCQKCKVRLCIVTG